MGLTWTLGGVDKSDAVRYREWALTECAERGQVGAGTILIDDTSGSYTPPGQKALTVVESAASPDRLFSGYVGERTAVRGRMAPDQRQWRVTVEDLNVLLDDRIVTDAMGGKRPAEDDVTRITWLLGTAAAGPITAGTVPASPTVNLDAADYRGKRFRDVIEDAAQKAGKTYFLYRYDTGTALLFYARPTSATLTSTATISDDPTAVDNVTTFGAIGVTYTLDPSRVYSRVRVRYKRGSETVNNATTAANYRTREVYKRWMRVKTAARATEQAQEWLDAADDETRTISLSVVVPAAAVNLIRAGMRVQISLTRYGFTGVYWRVTKRTVRQVSDTFYELDLTFAEKIRSTAFFSGPDIAVDEEMSNASEDAASTIIDEDGLTITGGALVISNGASEVIIDGSSDFFSIVATGILEVPQNLTTRGTQYASVTITTGLEQDPASLFFAKMPAKDGKGNWAQPLPELSLSASGTILRMVSGRARYSSGTGAAARTQVQIARFTSSPPEASVRVRYYVLQKTAI